MRTAQWMILWAALAATGCQNISPTEHAQRDAQTAETELRLVQGRLADTRALLNIQPPDSPSHQQLNIQVALLDRQANTLQDRLSNANRATQQTGIATAPSGPTTTNTPVASATPASSATNTPVPAGNVPDAAAIAAAFAAAGLGGNTPAGPADPADPADAVRHWIDELANNRPAALWAALPDTFHTQVKDLITQSAQDIDPEVFIKTITVAKKANTVLKTKKALILQMLKTMPGPNLDEGAPEPLPLGAPADATNVPALPAGLPPGLPQPLQPGNPPSGLPLPLTPSPPGTNPAPGGPDVNFTMHAEQNWGSVTGLIDAFLNSQLADPQWHADPALNAFFKSEGDEITRHFLDLADAASKAENGMSVRQLAKLLVIKALSEDGATAKVRISPPADPAADPNDPVGAIELDLEKTGNQWRIAKLGDELSQAFAEAQADLKDNLPPTSGPEKVQILTILNTMETKLETLAKAADLQEFQAQAMELVMGLAANQPGAQTVPAPDPGVFGLPATAPGGRPLVDPDTGLPLPSPPRPPNGRPGVPVPNIDPGTGLPIAPRPAPGLPPAPAAPPKKAQP